MKKRDPKFTELLLRINDSPTKVPTLNEMREDRKESELSELIHGLAALDDDELDMFCEGLDDDSWEVLLTVICDRGRDQ